MNKCPSCGHDGIFVKQCYSVVIPEGKLWMANRIPARCNNTQCEQRFWFHPNRVKNRVTRRNVGKLEMVYA